MINLERMRTYVSLMKKQSLELNFNLNDYLEVKSVRNKGKMACYKDYPLWSSSVPKEYLYIGIYDPNKTKRKDDPTYYYMYCVDCFGDLFYYGKWYSKDSLMEFLNHPNEQTDELKKIEKLFFDNMDK